MALKLRKKKEESAPYVAKTEDGAELNPVNKGEKMFDEGARYAVYTFGDRELKTLLETDDLEEAKECARENEEKRLRNFNPNLDWKIKSWGKVVKATECPIEPYWYDLKGKMVAGYTFQDYYNKAGTFVMDRASGTFSSEKMFGEGCKYDWHIVIVRPKNDPSLKLKRYLSNGWHAYNPKTRKEDGPVEYALYKYPTTSGSCSHVTEEELEKGVDHSGNRFEVTSRTWDNESEEATDYRKAGFSIGYSFTSRKTSTGEVCNRTQTNDTYSDGCSKYTLYVDEYLDDNGELTICMERVGSQLGGVVIGYYSSKSNKLDMQEAYFNYRDMYDVLEKRPEIVNNLIKAHKEHFGNRTFSEEEPREYLFTIYNIDKDTDHTVKVEADNFTEARHKILQTINEDEEVSGCRVLGTKKAKAPNNISIFRFRTECRSGGGRIINIRAKSYEEAREAVEERLHSNEHII